MDRSSPATSALAAKYARPVPRYTSYPTAPHFGPEIDGARYGAWLDALGDDGPLSLYFHIPFCRSLCWFCGCCTKVVNRYAPVARYLDLLVAEIDRVAKHLDRPRHVSNVHLGGGTPTLLDARDLERLFDAMRRNFILDDDADLAIEVDPRVLSREQAAALGRVGITRASLGVQDFAPAVQNSIHRIQSFRTTARTTELLRSAGVARINLDLIYGLPHQTVESVAATVDRAMTLAPDRLAIFGYAHVPWMKKHQRLIPEAALPGPSERLAQLQAATARVAAHGYVAIGIDHFARPDDAMVAARESGRLRRNFQGYTVDRGAALIGFGVSAIGTLPQGYAQNATDVAAYAAAIERGALATVRGIALADDDRLRREIIERLMCDFEAPIDEIALRHGATTKALDDARAGLEPMIADGMVSLEDGWLKLTEAGRPLVRAVCATFDRYLDGGAARHSAAV